MREATPDLLEYVRRSSARRMIADGRRAQPGVNARTPRRFLGDHDTIPLKLVPVVRYDSRFGDGAGYASDRTSPPRQPAPPGDAREAQPLEELWPWDRRTGGKARRPHLRSVFRTHVADVLVVCLLRSV